MKLKRAFKYFPFYPSFFMVWQSFKYGISFQRLPVLLIYLIKQFLFEPFRLLELYFIDCFIYRTKVTNPPIFILGHWRSGTTHLQNLIQTDPNTKSITIYSSLYPDGFILTEFWLKPILNFFVKLFKVPYSIQRSALDLNYSGELDTAMLSMASPGAYTWAHLFPKHFEAITEELIYFKTKNGIEEWKHDYNYLIKKLAFVSKNKTIVIKSPGDTARIKLLLELYPQAKFIYIHRDPLDVYYSNLHLWSVVLKEYALQKFPNEKIHSLIVSTYVKLVNRYQNDRKLLDEKQLIEIRFEELQQQPVETLRKIYSKFNMNFDFSSSVDAFVKANPKPQEQKARTYSHLQEEIIKNWTFTFRQ